MSGPGRRSRDLPVAKSEMLTLVVAGDGGAGAVSVVGSYAG